MKWDLRFIFFSLLLCCIVFSFVVHDMERHGSGWIWSGQWPNPTTIPAIFIVSKFEPKLDVNVQIMASVYGMCVYMCVWLLQEILFFSNVNI